MPMARRRGRSAAWVGVAVGAASSRIGSQRRPTCAPLGMLAALPETGIVTRVFVLAIGRVPRREGAELERRVGERRDRRRPERPRRVTLPTAPLRRSLAVTPRATSER